MFCEVERSYIEDGFNLYGLRSFVSNFSDCLDLILDRIGADDSDDSHLTQSACTLYGLIHARYIITAHGLDAMYNKVSLPISYISIQFIDSDSYNFADQICSCICFTIVCCKRIRHMPSYTMFRSTRFTSRSPRRNGSRHR